MGGAQGGDTDGMLAEPRFRAFAETAPDAMLAGDAEGRIAYANAAAQRMFGHPAEAMIGQPLQLLIPERLRDAHTNGYRRFVATGKGRLIGTTVDVLAEHADGSEFPIELSLGTAGTGGDRILTAVIRDVSDRRRRERHLAAQLAVTALLAESRSASETGERIVEELTRSLGWDVGTLWLLDSEGVLRARYVWAADPAGARPFIDASLAFALAPGEGLPGEALAGLRPAWLEDVDASPTFVRRAAAQASGLRGGVCLPLVTDGRAVGALECFTHERAPADDALRDLLMTVASQVGEYLQRREAEERLQEAQAHVAEMRERSALELERSNAELEAFAHVAAHDLRTPLQTIAGFAQLIERRYGEGLPAEGRDFLRMILESAESSQRLLTRLLSYARAGGADTERAPVALRAVVDEVLMTMTAQIEERDARVAIGELPDVVADRVQLAQVLQNLMTNAIKFTPPERRPEVEVSAGREDDMVSVSVADRGIGVADEEAGEVFGMFRRGSGGVSFEGTGIGLAVAAKVVAGHGGRLWVTPREGGGSVFEFTLPVAPALGAG